VALARAWQQKLLQLPLLLLMLLLFVAAISAACCAVGAEFGQ